MISKKLTNESHGWNPLYSDLVPLAILHGIVLEVCVPILVGAFC